MTGRPTVQVLLDDGTGTFPHDVTAFVLQNDGHKFNRGRDDEQSSPTVGILNLVFNNTGGEFSPGSTGLDTPSPIVVDQQIRLKETVNGTLYTRYTGYVKSWRVGWPGGGDVFSVVRVTASNAQARGERRPLASSAELVITSLGATAYYPLTEPQDADTAADRSGNQNPMMVQVGSGAAAPVFGTKLGATNLDSAQFAGGKILRASPIAVATDWTWAVGFASTSVVSGTPFCQPPGGDTLNLNSGGGTGIGGTGLFGPVGSGLNDGAAHAVVISYSAGTATATVYIDGVSVTTYTPGTLTLTSLAAGGGVNAFTGDIDPAFTGNVGQVALWPTALTSTQAADVSTAIRLGFPAERADERIDRIATYVGLPLGTLDTSLTDVPSKDYTGVSAWSAIQDTVDADGGLGIIDASGELVFVNRNDAPEKTTPDVTIAAAFVTPGVEPTDDDAEIINYFEGTAEGTGVAQLVRDLVSEEAHDRYPESKTYLVNTDQEALARANWVVGVNAEPATRYPSLTINLLNMTASQQEAAIAAIEPGAWLRVTGMNTQTPGGTTVDVMVQGFTETLTENEWSLSCNVVARAKFEAAIYADATCGVYGESVYYY